MSGITRTESVVTSSQPTACDIMFQDSNAEEASASTEIQSTLIQSTSIQFTSIPAATNDKAQGGQKALTDLDYLDGPTVIAEVWPFFHTCESCSLGCGSRPSHMRQRATARRQQ